MLKKGSVAINESIENLSADGAVASVPAEPGSASPTTFVSPLGHSVPTWARSHRCVSRVGAPGASFTRWGVAAITTVG